MTDPITATATTNQLELSGNELSLAKLDAWVNNKCRLALDDSPAVIARMSAAESVVHRAVEEDWRVYGVTTGFGGMSAVKVPREQAADLQGNLLAFLATGVGPKLDPRHVRAAMILRANMLMKGRSGVRFEIVRRLAAFVNAEATPIVRCLGSIGASGDLVPLSVVARAITGQLPTCQVSLNDQELDSLTALSQLQLEPLPLQAKEGLAIVNGTSFSSAIAANCCVESRKLLVLSLATNAIMLQALLVQDDPFHAFVHKCKPHPGQIWTAKVMRQLLTSNQNAQSNGATQAKSHVQDRYSLRCLPQYFGPIVEGMAKIERVVEIEMNSVSDNPLIDADQNAFYQSGNFLGQYIGVSMDELRRHLGLMAKHLDVQIAQLVSPEFSRGLPESLVGNQQRTCNMGLKGLQISGNSIMPLLTYYGNPLVEHFPTHAEQFNQNVNGLSWGAANLAWQSVEWYQHYLAIAMIFAVQAIDLRAHACYGHYDGRALLSPTLEDLYGCIYQVMSSEPGEDRPFIYNDADQSLESILAAIHQDLTKQQSIVDAVNCLVDSFACELQQP